MLGGRKKLDLRHGAVAVASADLVFVRGLSDNLWLMGGWSKTPEQNWGDVWHSPDGRNWKELKSDVIWKARHEHSTYVHRDRIFVAGGHARPLSNEVWSLQLPADWTGK